MQRRYATLLPLLLLAACADEPTAPLAPSDGPSLSRAEQALSFTPINVPGAQFTGASGINAGGDVVGSYVDAEGKTRGFLLQGEEFTTIDYPGAILTEARGIGPDGTIVGTYRLRGEEGQWWAFHGFLRTSAGEFVPMDYPGLPYTMPQRILPDGTILGCHHAERFAGMEGVVMGAREDSEADNIHMSMHNGATPDLSRIAGLYTDMESGQTKGYVIDGGVFQSLLVPGSNLTQAWDVSSQGDVVGFYRTGSGPSTVVSGFLLKDEEYIPVVYPGSTHTRALGINARGDIVGLYRDAEGFHGFVATRRGG